MGMFGGLLLEGVGDPAHCTGMMSLGLDEDDEAAEVAEVAEEIADVVEESEDDTVDAMDSVEDVDNDREALSIGRGNVSIVTGSVEVVSGSDGGVKDGRTKVFNELMQSFLHCQRLGGFLGRSLAGGLDVRAENAQGRIDFDGHLAVEPADPAYLGADRLKNARLDVDVLLVLQHLEDASRSGRCRAHDEVQC